MEAFDPILMVERHTIRDATAAIMFRTAAAPIAAKIGADDREAVKMLVSSVWISAVAK